MFGLCHWDSPIISYFSYVLLGKDFSSSFTLSYSCLRGVEAESPSQPLQAQPGCHWARTRRGASGCERLGTAGWGLPPLPAPLWLPEPLSCEGPGYPLGQQCPPLAGEHLTPPAGPLAWSVPPAWDGPSVASHCLGMGGTPAQNYWCFWVQAGVMTLSQKELGVVQAFSFHVIKRNNNHKSWEKF